MCTAISLKSKDLYFGRTLDVEIDYPTSVVVCPRKFPLLKGENEHFAIIGMAMVFNDYPLFFDGTNEFGLSMAGLNFPKNACYFEEQEDKINLATYQLIPYILGRCKTTKDAEKLFKKINITKTTYNNMPNSPLHWIISDGEKSITIEQTEDGLKVFDNKIGVLTNNPTFDWHMTNLVNYLNITNDEPINRMLDHVRLIPFCKGMGGIGLPGDLSSPSRFVRVAFAKNRALTYDDNEKNVNQFFHILGNVEQTTGLAQANGSFEQTLYTSCVNATKGIYYYKTYFNSSINGVDMHKSDLNGNKLVIYPVKYKSQINIE